MSLLRLLVRHLAIGIASVWAVLTAVFGLFWVVVDSPSEIVPEAPTDASAWEVYTTLTWQFLTLDWGVATGGDPDRNTFAYFAGDPVLTTVLEGIARTAVYVLPAVAIGVTVAIASGLYVALHPESRLASGVLAAVYLVVAVPAFWIGAMAVSFTIEGAIPYSSLVFEHVLPILLVASMVLGAAVSYARAYSMEYITAEFVTLVEAKGAGRLRLAWHVLRNAGIPVVSMVFTETFALLVLGVFLIEVVFAIEGIGLVVYGAAISADLPVLLGAVLILVAAGVFANFLQDLSYRLLDPRVEGST